MDNDVARGDCGAGRTMRPATIPACGARISARATESRARTAFIECVRGRIAWLDLDKGSGAPSGAGDGYEIAHGSTTVTRSAARVRPV